MPAVEAFPSVDTGALDSTASSLKLIGGGISDTGTSVSALRGAVDGSEQWQGEAASRWSATVGDRVRDASLTGKVMTKAASLLDQLAADINAERRAYNQASAEMSDLADTFNPRFNPAPPDWDSSYLAAMNAAAKRASNLLVQTGNDFMDLAALAGDIEAATAANRMPGVPAGTSRHGASLALLAMLFGSVTGNQAAGSAFEAQVLSELGLTKNTSIWRPGTAFEGRATGGGLAKGTIPDADGPGYIVEVKNTGSLTARFQIRLEELYAQTTGDPLWVVVPQGAKVSPDVVERAEGTGGGVLFRTGPNAYEDGQGNPVQVGSGMKVSGYQPSTTGGGGQGPAGPSAPVNPDPAPADPAPAAPGPVDPGDPVGPEDPIEPFIP